MKPNDDLQTPSPCHHKPAARNATVTPASAWNGAGGTGAVTVARFSTPANDPSRNFPNHHHDHSAAIPTAVHTTPNVIITQTPDGRVLPVGSVPQVTTSPRGLFSRGGTGNGVSLNQGYPHATTASHASLTGPLLANRNTATPTAPAYGFANRTTPDREEMGPPPPRCPVVVTPAAAAATATTQPLQGTATTAVKPCEGPPDDGRVVSPGTQEQQKQTKDNPFHGADTRSKLPDAEENATGMFHEVHQQFVRTLRDFSDTESNYYKALLLDKMVEIDKATSIVLQVRVDVLDSIDQAEALQRKFAQAFRDVENDN